MHQLAEFVDSGIVPQLYQRFAQTLAVPKDPLVFVNSHPARELDKYLKAAGIEKHTIEGKIAFHALRTSFVTLAFEAGASHLEAQRPARRRTLELTANTYGRVRDGRLAEVAERIADRVLPRAFGAPERSECHSPNR